MTNNNRIALLLASVLFAPVAHSSVDLIAIGSISGAYEDLSTRTAAPLENRVAGNLLGGLGSGLAYAGGTNFLALPDRGPNALPYNADIDDTVSYIPRFQTFTLSLAPSELGASLPFVLTPTLRDTTLLSSLTPLVYGTGGEPTLNSRFIHYFTGRSDGFDANKPSSNPNNARLDPEGIRVSNDGLTVFISDEYGPYVYQFNRFTGIRTRAFKLPDELAVTKLSAQGDVEISNNTIGRVANKGMEGLAIAPDGKMLVGIMQAPLEQDTNKNVRIVTIDIRTGGTHQYAYQLTEGSGVSEILAINDHEFLVDERDGKGLGDSSNAKVKELFKIDLSGATDIAGKSGDLSQWAVPKTLFLDLVKVLDAHGITSDKIPSKIEGIAFGQDVVMDGATKHTLFVANDNDFTATVDGIDNPNQWYVFAFDDSDLPGFAPQQIKAFFPLCGSDR